MKCIYYERIDNTNKGICHHKNQEVYDYKCSSCKDKAFAAVAAIPVGRCDECRFCSISRTEGAGYALDYFCKAANKKIASYVEYDDEIPEVPKWCPYLI